MRDFSGNTIRQYIDMFDIILKRTAEKKNRIRNEHDRGTDTIKVGVPNILPSVIVIVSLSTHCRKRDDNEWQ